MSEPSARERFVEAMRTLDLLEVSGDLIRQAVEAFADVAHDYDCALMPNCDEPACRIGYRAALLKEVFGE